jgi:amino acid adenylation domain-containing protein
MGSETLTYNRLQSEAARLANYLRALGTGPDNVIGLCMERSPRFVIAALGIMQSGAAYLPMESTYPAERLRFMARDAGVKLIVTRQDLVDRFAGLGIKTILLEEIQPETTTAQSAELIRQPQEPDPLAYLIYTSGSSGEPKGVEVTDRNLSNLIDWHIRRFGLTSSSRGTFQASVGFDAAVWEIWPVLVVGATLCLPDELTRKSPELLRDWLVEQQITISFVPTAIAEQLITLSWPQQTALRYLLTGGDRLQRYPPSGLPFSLINNYGPTECTVVATSGLVDPAHSGNSWPTIGVPIDNVTLHVLDDQFRELNNGTPGEIYIGGEGVARGYRNRKHLTSQSFVPDPFSNNGQRLYRTGDLGRVLPNGEIVFLGRIDNQVKVRGYRIELDEISTILNGSSLVRASAVIAQDDPHGDKRLVAYIVPNDAECPEQALRRVIRQSLPDFMEPAVFVRLESLPLTANGKVDRAALPIPSVARSADDREFVPPHTPVETALCRIIEDVLKVSRVSVDDDFFRLGAHSLLGAQIVARVKSAFGAELKLLDVFDAPTVAQLSQRIEKAITRQLNAMSEAEVDAVLAGLKSGETTRGMNQITQ